MKDRTQEWQLLDDLLSHVGDIPEVPDSYKKELKEFVKCMKENDAPEVAYQIGVRQLNSILEGCPYDKLAEMLRKDYQRLVDVKKDPLGTSMSIFRTINEKCGWEVVNLHRMEAILSKYINLTPPALDMVTHVLGVANALTRERKFNIMSGALVEIMEDLEKTWELPDHGLSKGPPAGIVIRIEEEEIHPHDVH